MADKYVILIIYFSIFILLVPLLKSYWNSQRLQNKICYIGTIFCRRWTIKSCFYRLPSLGLSVVYSRRLTANKMADKNVILIIYFCIFIHLIPLLKSYWNSQHLHNKVSYIGTTFCRRWAIYKVVFIGSVR